ncbi:hypothetical protein [Nitriliruptor alkaliphilus]|uniref:hypothetical protein n=1 Tax=Nitriliruptor alkaliphilus TaxID=427918 RepID=UPI0006965413|nr:hypothetical protein [Nitriliruptor alkaliphilus]
MSELRTEFPFVLPKGFLDVDGVLHREGTMRLATAADEVEPLEDGSVRGPEDPSLPLVVLARVVTRLGSVGPLSPRDVRDLFAADLAHLREVYRIVNYGSPQEVDQLLGAGTNDSTSAPHVVVDVAAEEVTGSDIAAPGPSVRPTPTPVSDAARAMFGRAASQGAPSPWLHAVPTEREVDATDVAVAPHPAPIRKRARIEEVGRSTGRPGGR